MGFFHQPNIWGDHSFWKVPLDEHNILEGISWGNTEILIKPLVFPKGSQKKVVLKLKYSPFP